MARNAPKVYLGFEDEEVTDQNKHLVDYTTNKIGGLPNFPGPEIIIPSCPVCGLRRALIAQIYAPLEHSPFHRTLYIFSCVNAVCSNQPLGWTCVRVQHLDRQSPPAAVAAEEPRCPKAPKPNINWCSGADDWGDDGDDDCDDRGAVGGIDMDMAEVAAAVDGLQLSAGATDTNCNEPNGNVLRAAGAALPAHVRNDNRRSNAMSEEEEEEEEVGDDEVASAAVEEDDDESNSLASDEMVAVIRDQAAVQLPLQMPTRNDNDRNANGGGGGGGQKKPPLPPDEGAVRGAIGAVGRLQPNCGATAEIEGVEDDDELVTIDAPVQPKRDLIALLKQTNAVPTDPRKVVLKSYFVAVAEEERPSATSGAIGEHVRELLLDYQSRDEKNAHSPGSPAASHEKIAASGAGGGGADGDEKYEKAVPAHGDLYFHNFITTLHENPGQLLRYTRDALPLLVAPLPDKKWPPCGHCAAPMICEVQLLSTLIPTLRFAATGDTAPLEFYNVLVFTCEKSCWDTPDQWRIEPIVVQPEF